jgi:hypothetical protein
LSDEVVAHACGVTPSATNRGGRPGHRVAQISRPEMDALKQSFDRDAMVILCKVAARGDNLQPGSSRRY